MKTFGKRYNYNFKLNINNSVIISITFIEILISKFDLEGEKV